MEIFPEDKIDPTAGAKEEQYPVERTLGVMGHVRAIAKKRKWQYLNESEMPEGSSTAVTFIRKFYKQPETAAVTHKDGIWAVWSGEGEPTDDAFPEYEPIDQGPGSEFLKGLQARLGIEKRAEEFVKAQTPSEPQKEGAVAFASSSGLNDHDIRDFDAESEATARAAAFKRVASEESYETASKAGQEAWAFSSINIYDHAAMRRRFGTGHDAVIEMHPTGRLAAIWLGKSKPTRPAFLDVQPAPEGLHKNGTLPNGTNLDDFHAAPMPPVPPPFIDDITPSKTRPPTDDLPRPVKVSGHVPSAALNEMGVKLYGMSKEHLYSEKLRQYLANVSDSLHAEAARIELGKMREKLDARDRPAADQTVVRIPPPGEK